MNKIVFLSAVYPGAEPFLSDFLTSLSEQEDKHFDTVLVNDGLGGLARFTAAHPDLAVREVKIPQPATTALVREEGLRHVLEQKYEMIVFGDCDDRFQSNRIGQSRLSLGSYDMVVNDIDLMDSRNTITKRHYLSERFKNGATLTLDSVMDKNCFGMSNTAIHARCLRAIPLHAELIAVDWYLFSRLLLNGARAVFNNETTTFYRQHGGNTIGLDTMSDEKIATGIQTKLVHYREMAKVNDRYLPFFNGMMALQTKLTQNKTFKEGYYRQTREEHIKNPLWWENIRPLKDIQHDPVISQ